ncbi:MAG: NAD-dependent epimerase/dehydratase family protein [Mizugakiibacter sp.]|uniref:NAD-dependent epimerase/dehydratase family protein n=1 Tax=Mizugakiibacter sp. TaxID=1972610 RepID=UPI0031CA855B|nr:NAD-dependent epimerase/dehydratase family protein [Xanthomonadaceae bacterium]
MATPADAARPRLLLTGSTGFTGRYVRAELERAGWHVTGLGHAAQAPAQADAGELTVDLLDRDAVARAVAGVRPDAVIHLAAIAFVAHGDVDAIYRCNVVGTRHLLEALAALPRAPRAVILASSANVYGNTTVEPIDEDTPPAPANDYAVSKLAMEYMARLWCGQLPITLVRPFNYTGVGQSPQFLIPKIVDHFRRRADTIELGNLQVWREFQDVRAVAECYRRLLEASPPPGSVFNLCSGQAWSLQEVLAMMESIAGYRIAVRVNPAFVRANEVRRLVGSNARLAGAIGALPAIPLQETLRWMYAAPAA